MFDGEVKERFVVFWLNSANVVTGFEVISEGTLNSSVVHPREVFRGSIVATCANIILAHNHPSGNLSPSSQDIQLTSHMKEAAKLFDIQVLDHLIINAGYYSMADEGMI